MGASWLRGAERGGADELVRSLHDAVKPKLYYAYDRYADAYLRMPSKVKPEAHPSLFHTDGELEALYSRSLAQGQEVMTHAIGDLAVEQVVRVSKLFPRKRLRVEHNELVVPEELEKEELGLVCSMQPNFLQWAAPGGLYEKRLGGRVLENNNHFRCLLDAGVVVAFGSDSMPLGPLYGIRLALNPPYRKQKLSLQEAITCYTYNAAYACRLESMVGSLEPGKLADLVVLAEKPELRVLATYLDGRLAYCASDFREAVDS